MANYAVIAAVSETLKAVLLETLSTLSSEEEPKLSVDIHDLQFADPPSGMLLTIFLFEVGEDPSARNRPRLRENTPPDVTIRKPPMALLLRYLLTAWAGDRATEQKILGRAIQTLYDRPILSGPDLQGVLINTDEALKVSLAPLSLEDLTRVWHSVQRPYRLSVSYEVRVANLDAEETGRVRPVGRRALDFEELGNNE